MMSRDNLDIAEISVENYHDVDDFGRTLKNKILADLQEVKNSQESLKIPKSKNLNTRNLPELNVPSQLTKTTDKIESTAKLFVKSTKTLKNKPSYTRRWQSTRVSPNLIPRSKQAEP